MWEDARLRLIGHRDRGGRKQWRKAWREREVLNDLVGKLHSSSFHLSNIFLSPLLPASLTHLYPFTRKPKRSSLLFLHTLPHTLSGLPQSPCLCFPLGSPAPPHLHSLLLPVFHRRFRKSQPHPSIYEIAHVISCLILPPVPSSHKS